MTTLTMLVSINWFGINTHFFINSSYLFDMRRLKKPLNIFKDHVSAVIDMDFSPTGRELVTGSYDKTIRIFEVDKVCGIICRLPSRLPFYVLINFLFGTGPFP